MRRDTWLPELPGLEACWRSAARRTAGEPRGVALRVTSGPGGCPGPVSSGRLRRQTTVAPQSAVSSSERIPDRLHLLCIANSVFVIRAASCILTETSPLSQSSGKKNKRKPTEIDPIPQFACGAAFCLQTQPDASGCHGAGRIIRINTCSLPSVLHL